MTLHFKYKLFFVIISIFSIVYAKNFDDFATMVDTIQPSKEAFANRILTCKPYVTQDEYLQVHLLIIKEICLHTYLEYKNDPSILNTDLFEKYKNSLEPMEFNAFLRYIFITFTAIAQCNPNGMNDLFLLLVYTKIFKHHGSLTFFSPETESWFYQDDAGFLIIKDYLSRGLYLVLSNE